MKALESNPSFCYGSYIYTEGRVVILDHPTSDSIQNALRNLESQNGQPTILVNPMELSKTLDELVTSDPGVDEGALVVFPGNGGSIARSYAKFHDNKTWTEVFAKRWWQPGTDPIAIMGEILPEQLLIFGYKAVLVIDDVISSGKTLSGLRERNAWKFNGASWMGATWISQIPRSSARSGVRGYNKIMAALLVEGPNNGRVPINSLSTLLRDPEICNQYAHRHFSRPQDLIGLVTSLTA
jgi:hypothetical protein